MTSEYEMEITPQPRTERPAFMVDIGADGGTFKIYYTDNVPSYEINGEPVTRDQAVAWVRAWADLVNVRRTEGYQGHGPVCRAEVSGTDHPGDCPTDPPEWL